MSDKPVEITRDGAVAWLRLDAYNDGHADGWDEAFDAIEVNLRSHSDTWARSGVSAELIMSRVIKDLPHLRALRGYERSSSESDA